MIGVILFLLALIFIPRICILLAVYKDPWWTQHNKDREKAFTQYGEYPPEVDVDYWGNKTLDTKKLIRWLVKTGQFRKDTIPPDGKIKVEWSQKVD